MVDGKLVPDPNFVTLKGGFRPGLTYEVAFEAQDPPVAGLGLAAVRDMASSMKYDPRSVAPGTLRLHVRLVADRPDPAADPLRGLHHRREGAEGVRRRVREDRRGQHGPLQRAFRALELPGRLPGDAIPLPVPDHDGPGDRKAGRDRRPHPRGPRAEGLPVRQRVGVLGQGPSGRAAPRLDRRDRGSARRAQREGLLRGGIAARLRERCPRPTAVDSSRTTPSTTSGSPAVCCRRSTRGSARARSRRPAGTRGSRTGRWSRTRTSSSRPSPACGGRPTCPAAIDGTSRPRCPRCRSCCPSWTRTATRSAAFACRSRRSPSRP